MLRNHLHKETFMLRSLVTAVVAVLFLAVAVPSAFAQPSNVSSPGFQLFAFTADGDAVAGDLALNTNSGASGAVVLTLPACQSAGTQSSAPFEPKSSTVGTVVRVFLLAAQDVDIEPGSAAINGDTAGDQVSSDATVGSHITLVCVSDGNWRTFGSAGTWSAE